MAKWLNGTGTSEPGRDTFRNVYRLTSDSRTWALTSSVPGHEVRVDLALCPGSLPSTSDSLAASLYAPGDAAARGKGITFKIPQVAQQNGMTAIQVETLLDPTGNGLSPRSHSYLEQYRQENGQNQVQNVELMDDAGNHYALQKQNMPGAIGGPITSFEFDPIRAEARRAILRIHQIYLDDLTSVPFALDLGSVPEPGQTLDLKGQPGSEYQINGYTISLLSARYAKVHERASVFSAVDRDVYTLEFTARVTPPRPDYTPMSVKLEINGTYQFTSQGNLLLTAYFANPLTDQLVTGKIGEISGTLKGPWEIQWDLPK